MTSGRLRERGLKSVALRIARMEWKKILEMIDAPNWANARKVHDWRNHVPDGIVELWDFLDRDSKLVAFLMALERAEAEEWD